MGKLKSLQDFNTIFSRKYKKLLEEYGSKEYSRLLQESLRNCVSYNCSHCGRAQHLQVEELDDLLERALRITYAAHVHRSIGSSPTASLSCPLIGCSTPSPAATSRRPTLPPKQSFCKSRTKVKCRESTVAREFQIWGNRCSSLQSSCLHLTPLSSSSHRCCCLPVFCVSNTFSHQKCEEVATPSGVFHSEASFLVSSQTSKELRSIDVSPRENIAMKSTALEDRVLPDFSDEEDKLLPSHVDSSFGGRSQSVGDWDTPPPLPERSDSLLANEEEELKAAAWFQAGIPREIALEVLSREAVGAFMVRDSTSKPGCFALSLRVPRDFADSGIAHYLIVKASRGYRIKGFSKEFDSLTTLITHHSVMPELLPCALSLRSYVNHADEEPSNAEDEEPDYSTLSHFRRIMADLKF